MPSSVIRAFAYDAEMRRLEIVFTTGRVYLYHDVPPRTVAALGMAESKGRYFNAHIRDCYRFTRRREKA